MIRRFLPAAVLLALSSATTSGCAHSEGFTALYLTAHIALAASMAAEQSPAPATEAPPTPPLPDALQGAIFAPALTASFGDAMDGRILDGSASLLFPVSTESDFTPFFGGGLGVRRFTLEGAEAQTNPYVGVKGGVRYDGLGAWNPGVEAGYGLGSEWNFGYVAATLFVNPRELFGGS